MVVLLALAISLTAGTPARQQTAQSVARESVENTITEAIRVLEAKDYRKFLLEFIRRGGLRRDDAQCRDAVELLRPATGGVEMKAVAIMEAAQQK